MPTAPLPSGPDSTLGPLLSRFVPLNANRFGENILITKMHLMNPRTELAPAAFGNRQNTRLLIALSLLLVLLGAVLIRDREFWFGSEQATEAAATVQPTATETARNAKASIPVSATTLKNHTAKAAVKPAVKAASTSASSERVAAVSQTQDAPVVATSRVALPPLDVEVVAGDKHSTIHPGSNITHVEIPAGQKINASQREVLTAATAAPELRQTIETVYPTLGQNSRVQGSVVLQAIVGADGSVENLRVLSGPAILATAAQQAVRQWHFKPVLQNGQAVETKARITVNFTIRVADESMTASNTEPKIGPGNGGE